MYRTASNLEDLDIEMELNSFDSVYHAVDRSGFWSIEDKYHDVDFYVLMKDDSEEDEIIKVLTDCCMEAYLEYEEKGIFKINSCRGNHFKIKINDH